MLHGTRETNVHRTGRHAVGWLPSVRTIQEGERGRDRSLQRYKLLRPVHGQKDEPAMSLYIIKHDAPAVKYLAPTGAKRAYTDKLQCARTFHTKEHAERARCPGNERVESSR